MDVRAASATTMRTRARSALSSPSSLSSSFHYILSQQDPLHRQTEMSINEVEGAWTGSNSGEGKETKHRSPACDWLLVVSFHFCC